MDISNEKENGIVRKMIDQRLDNIITEKQILESNIKDLEELTSTLQLLSIHPRHDSLLPLSNLVYIEGQIAPNEYITKQGDYKIVKSPHQAYEYMNEIILNYKDRIAKYGTEQDQIHERAVLLDHLMNRKVVTTDQGFMYDRDGFIEIIELGPDPLKKGPRVAKFKTNAERDAYLKNK